MTRIAVVIEGPHRLVEHAARQIRAYLSSEREQHRARLDRSLNLLAAALSEEVARRVKEAGLETAGQLAAKTSEELKALGFGPAAIHEIEAFLDHLFLLEPGTDEHSFAYSVLHKLPPEIRARRYRKQSARTGDRRKAKR